MNPSKRILENKAVLFDLREVSVNYQALENPPSGEGF
jgi:hypothetical protein